MYLEVFNTFSKDRLTFPALNKDQPVTGISAPIMDMETDTMDWW